MQIKLNIHYSYPVASIAELRKNVAMFSMLLEDVAQ